MNYLKNYDFTQYVVSPEVLAKEVIKQYFKDVEPSFPLDPFRILKDFGVIIVPREFKKLEGIYVAPENENDIPLVAINKKRPATRQRFTAAHELCHHIKDRNNESICCPIGSGNPIEKFANEFASRLLMPVEYLEIQVQKYEKNGQVSLEDVVYIADYFGVSFKSCACTIAYKLGKLQGDIHSKILNKRIEKLKPDKKRLQIGLPLYDINLLRNIINSYSYIIADNNLANWYKFKNDFIYNENRLEGVKLTQEQIAEIVTDLRINEQDSKFCNYKNKDVIEVLGHSKMYEYILETDDDISVYSIKDLHKILYIYSPHPELGGVIRTNSNYIEGAYVETVDYALINEKIFDLGGVIDKLVDNMDKYNYVDYIDQVVKIHHQLTIIHPFQDGNGRVSRAMLNWLFKLKGLPPVYIDSRHKSEYYSALEKADEGNYEELYAVFYRSIMNSLIQLNNLFCL